MNRTDYVDAPATPWYYQCMEEAMTYCKERDVFTGRTNIDDISDYDAMGYDAAPRAGRWHYKMTQRPFSIGCQPKDGFVEYRESSTPKDKSGFYGLLIYSRKLSEDEIRRFELTQVGRER